MPDSPSSNGRLEALARRLQNALAGQSPPGAVICFDLGAEGCLLVDARRVPPTVSTESGPADCTLSMRLDTLERLLAGGLDGPAAFMKGKITISGDVELAGRLNEMLGRAGGGAPDADPTGERS